MNTLLSPQPQHHYHFVTGKLAEAAVREVAGSLAATYHFDYSIGVMPITVAALMTPRWLRRHLQVPADATHVIVPGYCHHGIDELAESIEIPVICGPNDCRAMAELFGETRSAADLVDHDIAIIAEINHAPRLSRGDLVSQAKSLRDQGADMIDFGCDPAAPDSRIGESIQALVDEGLQVSVDTFDPREAAEATRCGAQLVLSVNSQNRNAATDWGTEVVVIPDAPGDEKSLCDTVDFLVQREVPIRLDPILEPIGAGFAASLCRYAAVRHQFPDQPMMMGIGNLTELSDTDSAGVNLMLLGICQELGIHSVLTTQVINWARSSVRECDIARRMVHYAVQRGVPPKNLSDQLVMLRDARLRPYSAEALRSLADAIKDNNYRIFAQQNQLHLLAAGLHLHHRDPFFLFQQLMNQKISDNVDPGHAFYLGYEMAKASIALQLGKQYQQDESLDWGMLTEQEDFHRIERTNRHRNK